MCSAATLQTCRMQVDLHFRCLLYHRDNSLTITLCFLKMCNILRSWQTLWIIAHVALELSSAHSCRAGDFLYYYYFFKFVFLNEFYYCFENLAVLSKCISLIWFVVPGKNYRYFAFCRFVCWPLGCNYTCIHLWIVWAECVQFIKYWHPQTLVFLYKNSENRFHRLCCRFQPYEHRCVKFLEAYCDLWYWAASA